MTLTFTVADRKWLKTMRISPDDVCPTCKGDGCTDCAKAPIRTIQEPEDEQC